MIEIDPPRNSIDNIGEFGSDAQAKTAMAGLYVRIMTGSGQTMVEGLLADELVVTQGAIIIDDYQCQRNRLQKSNFKTSSLWIEAYQNTYIANGILENLPQAGGVSDTTKNELLAEAKFARAFSYFYLTNLFGDVPLVLTSDFAKTARLAKSPQVDIFKQITQDLIDAQTYLHQDYAVSLGKRTVPNKLAATAMLARVYLYQKNWKDAESQATNVINSDLLSLNTDLKKVFLKDSRETIWQLEANTTVANNNLTFQEVTAFRPPLVYSELSADDQALYLIPDVYAPLSPFMIPNYTLRPEFANAVEPGDLRSPAWIAYAKSPEEAPYNGVTTYFPSKYKELQSAGTPASEYEVVLRLAEQYLIRAEARAQLNDIAGAASDLNRIRSRAGLPNTTASSQTAMLDAIMQERRVEFFAEWGHRWFDLKRTGQAVKAFSSITDKQPFNTSQLLCPIPETEVIRDPFITQNPGY